MVAVFLAHHDVDGSAEGGNATGHELGGGEEFDALHHGDVDGDVEEEMSGLGIGDVHAVEEENHLVKGSSAHGEVALDIVAAARAEVDAGKERNEVADGADRRVGEIVSGENRRRLGRAEKGVRRSNDSDGGKEAFVEGVFRLGECLHGEQEGAEGEYGSGFLELAVGNVGGQTANVDYPMQGIEGGIGRTAEASETKRTGFVLNVLVHLG